MASLIIFGVLVAMAVILLSMMFFTVEQQTAAVVQRFGKFVRVATSGLNVKVPLIDWVAGRMNLRVQQLNVKVETKTHDNVFVHVTVSVQFFVKPDRVGDAFYQLDDPDKQITAFVFDVVRAKVPTLALDKVFEEKDAIADAVREQLSVSMAQFGFDILKALVTDIEPDAKVKAAMNEINAAQRMREAASAQGDAEKILVVKKAEAEAESKALQGQGIANQRKAIINGLQESVDAFQRGVPGASASDVMALVMLTQYFDTLKDIGARGNSHTVFVPSGPGGMSDLTQQMLAALAAAGQLVSPPPAKTATP